MKGIKEASEDFDNLNQALRILAASIEDHINNLTQGKSQRKCWSSLKSMRRRLLSVLIIDSRLMIIFLLQNESL